MFDKKNLIVIFSCFMFISTGFIDDILGSSIIEDLKVDIMDIFGPILNNTEDKGIDKVTQMTGRKQMPINSIVLSTDFSTFDSFDFNTINSDIFFIFDNGEFILNDLKIKEENMNLLSVFNGKISVNKNNIIGKGNSVIVNIGQISFTSEKMTDFQFNVIGSGKIENINDDIEINKINGTIKINEKYILNLKNSSMKIDNFNGKIKLDKNGLKLDGKALKISIYDEHADVLITTNI